MSAGNLATLYTRSCADYDTVRAVTRRPASPASVDLNPAAASCEHAASGVRWIESKIFRQVCVCAGERAEEAGSGRIWEEAREGSPISD